MQRHGKLSPRTLWAALSSGRSGDRAWASGHKRPESLRLRRACDCDGGAVGQGRLQAHVSGDSVLVSAPLCALPVPPTWERGQQLDAHRGGEGTRVPGSRP